MCKEEAFECCIYTLLFEKIYKIIGRINFPLCWYILNRIYKFIIMNRELLVGKLYLKKVKNFCIIEVYMFAADVQNSRLG